ncbi:uncharacterized protein A4U43_C08F5820 [Asparagus officinalis]|nr:uncharacterized protein A4U43_C08F5820 [Asparagus officinalis]
MKLHVRDLNEITQEQKSAGRAMLQAMIHGSLLVELKAKSIPSCYFYYDMSYSVDYSTFQTMEIRQSNDVLEKVCAPVLFSES